MTQFSRCLSALSICLILLSACRSEEQLFWHQHSSSASQWINTQKSNTPDTSATHAFSQSGIWEYTFQGEPSPQPILAVAFLAPENVLFELSLNGKLLIKNDVYTVWPTTNQDSIFIYHEVKDLKPYHIDTTAWKSALKNGDNKLKWHIKSRNNPAFDADRTAIFIQTKNKKPNSISQFPHSNVLVGNQLPTLFIDSKNYLIPNEPKNEALLTLQCNSSDPCEELQRNIRIEVRGFSSASYPKKQYAFTIAGDSTQKEKVSFFGMKAARKWILQGPYSDPSLIRNTMVYQLHRNMGYWSPDTRFVEVVVNGNYQGVYALMERIDGSKARLNIEADTLQPTAFLVQLNRRKTTDDIIEVRDYSFILSDLPKLKIDDGYRNRTRAFLEQFLQEIDRDPSASSSIDLPSFIDFMLLQELTKNADAYKVSTWFHRRENGRIIAGPAWDFDLSTGGTNLFRSDQPDGWIYNTDKSIPTFFVKLMEDPEVQKQMAQRYLTLRQSILSDAAITQLIDDQTKAIGQDAIDRNFNRFDVLGKDHIGSYYHIPNSHAEEIAKLKNWWTMRLAWLDTYFQAVNRQ